MGDGSVLIGLVDRVIAADLARLLRVIFVCESSLPSIDQAKAE
jgi:hypothetical protein